MMGRPRGRSEGDTVTVLHVDDDPAFSDVVSTFLERGDEHISVETATSADAGMARLGAGGVDCVVSDYDMPGTNGIEFLEVVRAEDPELPFILYTGKGSEEVASEAISAGVTDYLQKDMGTAQYEVLANRIINGVEKHRSQRAVVETEELLSQIAENADDVLYVFDSEWRELLFVNSAYEDIWGESAAELEAEPRAFLDRVHPDDRDVARASIDRLSLGKADDVEYRVVRPDGEQRWIRGRSKPVFDEAGQVRRIVGYVRDVTEQKEHVRRLETLVDNLPGMVYRCRNEPEWPLEYVRGEVAALTGYPPEHLVDGDIDFATDVIHPDDREDVWEAVQAALDDGEPFELTYRIVTAEGATRWVWERGRAVDPGDGEQGVGLEGFITDVTERVEAQAGLREREERFRQLADNIEEVVWMSDPDKDELIYVNPAYEAVWGRPIDGLYREPTSFLEAIHPDDRDRVERAMAEQATGDYEEEYRVIQPDGEVRWVNDSAVPVEDDAGEVYRIVGIATDVTDLKRREEQLLRVRDLLEQSERTANVGGWEIDAHTMEVFWTEHLFAILGRDDDAEPPLEEALELYHEDDRAAVEAAVETALESGEAFDVEARFRRPDGEVRWARIQGRPLVVDGEVEAVRGAFQDVTDRKAREQELERQNVRLRQFASVVSHDLRSPLTVAQGGLDLAREDCATEHHDTVETALDRMSRIIDDVLSLAKEGRDVGELDAVRLGDVLESAWANVVAHEADGRLVVRDGAEDATVEADADRLCQLLENLFGNAIEHAAGPVTVTAGALPDGFYVEDDGPGIPEDRREEVFEPGVTTAAAGTGFGLAIVRQIADAHGWAVTVVEGDAGGARVEVTGVGGSG